MTKQFLAFGAAGAIALTAIGPIAQARAPAPAAARPVAAAASIVQGPPIPGLCVLSADQAIATSTVGRYVGSRMSQIIAQVKAELAPEETSLTNDAKALDAARPTLDAAAFQTRANALQVRANNLRQKQELRQREVSETQKKAVNRIAQELEPIARQLYQQKRCSALIDKGSVMMVNPQMDMTNEVVSGLNARIQQFAFDRERLDAGAPAR
jgi:Skp family chaperone for outer membrane proteins